MKQTSRKKVLVSSVAMMMVATVSLGSATYAWFTSNTTTKANGLNVKTIKSSELVISKSDRDWGQEVLYGQTGNTLRPVSTANGTAWFAGTAATKTNYDIATDGTYTTVTGQSGYYFTEELNIANKGSAAVENVTITIGNFNNKYGRIALVEVDEDGNAISGKTFANSVIDTDGVEYNAVTGAAKSSVTPITPSNDTEITVGTLAGKADGDELGGAKYYKLYVWFEGQDQQCVDGNAGQSIGDITFTIAGTTVEQ